MAGKTQKAGKSKAGRNKKKCDRYLAENRRAKNKARRIAKDDKRRRPTTAE